MEIVINAQTANVIAVAVCIITGMMFFYFDKNKDKRK